eukprot:5746558-Prymnesium_polylepis.1
MAELQGSDAARARRRELLQSRVPRMLHEVSAPHFLTLDETTLNNISPLGSGQSAGANAAA